MLEKLTVFNKGIMQSILQKQLRMITISKVQNSYFNIQSNLLFDVEFLTRGYKYM